MSIKTDCISYKTAVENLKGLIYELTDDEIEYIPEREDAWNIKQHLLHLLLCESESLVRLLNIENEEPNILNVDDTKSFLKRLKDKKINSKTCVNMLQNIEAMAAEIVSNYSEREYETKRILCSYNNEIIEVTIKENIESSIDHYEFHKEIIDENVLCYKEELF